MNSDHTEHSDPGAASGGGQIGAEPEGAEALMHAASARIAELEAERDDLHEKWVRAEAEAQNIRARARRDVDETRQYAVQKFATDVVEAAENIKRGLASLPPRTADEPDLVGRLRDGFEGVERSFVALLERNGIVRDDPTGKPFDPNLHQSMAEQPSADAAPGTVLQAWSHAWTLNGRLLRPAMVVVAKASPMAGPPEHGEPAPPHHQPHHQKPLDHTV